MASGKFTFHPFDTPNPTIQLASPIVGFTGTELYSDAAEFSENQNDGMDHRVPVLAAGNFPLGGGINSDSIFRVMEPWKILPYGGTYRLDVTGTVITDGGVSVPYINQTATFTVGEEINGQDSDALGFVAADTNPGMGDGTLIVTDVRGVFEDGEVVTGDQGGSATLNATPAGVVTNPFIDAPSGTVTIIVTAASSGTVAFSEVINDQSFLGRVWIDIVKGNPGTSFPRGTPTDLVNNFADARVIATLRKLNTYHLEGSLSIGSGENTEDTDWRGNSAVQTVLTWNGSSSLTNDYKQMTLTGTLNGVVTCTRVHLDNIVDFDGHAHDCEFVNNLTLLDGGGVEDIEFINCHSGVPGTATPILDCNGTDQGILFRDYTGGIEIRNYTQGEMSIDMDSGHVVLASSCTGGKIFVRGSAKLTDNSNGSDVDDSALVLTRATGHGNHAELGVGYDPSTTTLTFNAWLVRNDATVLSPTSVSVRWYQNDGTFVFTATDSSPDARGHFNFTQVQALTGNTVYYAVVQITDANGTVSTDIGEITID